MANIFNAGEVFSIGVQIEKNGRAFYNAAAAKSEDRAMKKLFSELADWESNHIEFFEHLRATLPADLRQDIEYDPDNMIHLFLKSVADNLVFKTGNNDIDSCETPVEIIKKALDFERDAVIVYSSMKEIVPENLGKIEIDKLINEELKHIGQLTKELAKLKK